MTTFNARLAAFVAAAAVAIPAAGSQAQSAKDFYKDNKLTMIIAGDVGGGFDVYTRLLVRYYANHIPGNPNIVVQNMPGASGVVGANHIANVAPKDGTVIASIYPGNVMDPILAPDAKKFQYDPRQLSWIGNISSLNQTCFTWYTSPIKTIDDARKREVPMGSNGPTSSSSIFANVMNTLLGTKFKVITGYSTGGMKLGVERGEIEGICGWGYDTLMASSPQWVTEKKLNFLAQSGLEKIPEMPDVPMVSEFTGDAVSKNIFKTLDLRTALGRPYVAPGGVPPERLAILRQAFDETMKDPAYKAEMEKAGLAMSPIDNVGMLKAINEAYGIPKDVLQRVAELTTVKE
jgi:tripartite-type tricarboxylate transporter receptor subunit TctC